MTGRDPKPTLVEAAAVFAAVGSYRQTMGLPPGDAVELPVYLAELKQAIDRVESVTLTDSDPR